MARVFNFSAGPAALPLEVLEQAREELTDWHGCGMSVMEISHRSKEFIGIAERAEADLRALLQIPEDYKVLFVQGGATTQFGAVPLNLAEQTSAADYLLTGSWSKKAVAEAQRFCDARAAASAADGGFTEIPDPSTWALRDDAAYLHYTPNETIGGVEFHTIPDCGDVPLVADMSSTILSRPLDVSKFGVIYAGAQKNIGPAGLTIVIVRGDLVDRARAATPTMLAYAPMAAAGSMLNTPPTFTWYVAGLVFALAAGAGRPRGHGRDQPGQGRAALRCHRRFRLLREPGARGLPLVDERAVYAGQAGAGRDLSRRSARGRVDQSQRSPFRRRHARQHL